MRLPDDAIVQIANAADGRTALVKTYEALAMAFATDPLLHRLVQFGMLELPEQIESLLRSHLYELIEVTSRNLAPWIECGPAHLKSKTIVLTFLATLMNYQVVAEAFQTDIANPLDTFRLCAELCSAASLDGGEWKLLARRQKQLKRPKMTRRFHGRTAGLAARVYRATVARGYPEEFKAKKL